jgi:putative ABC transport system permease protein
MTLATLAIRNLARNTLRVTLTVCSLAISLVAFLLVRTLLSEWEGAAKNATTERLVTRRRVSLLMELPKSFVETVRATPHVAAVTWANFFAGKDPNRPGDFFSSLAVDAATYFQVYDEVRVPPADLASWQHDKQGVIVGPELARKHGWKVGDTIRLESGLYPGAWPLRIDSIYGVTKKSDGQSRFFLHWDYLK